MFVRVKHNGNYDYLQLVDSQRIDGKVRQSVIGTLGRRDLLERTDTLAGLMASLNKFTRHALVLADHRCGKTEELWTRTLGPALVFGRLWEQLGLPEVLDELLMDRKFGFAVEWAIFLTVLHRLMGSAGRSDRAAEKWREDHIIPGVEQLDLQHLYRAMAWLGEELDAAQQSGATPFSPRCTKDKIEEALFARRQDLFTGLSLAFFDTTSLYFEGEGGESIGKHGHNKDHRPDLKQMVVGMVLSGEGRPICCEMWPGNTTEVKTLLPIVKRLRSRFGIRQVCIVADRGMISDDTIAKLEDEFPGLKYILGARLRSDHEVRDTVLSWGGAYHEVHGPRKHSKDPSPLKVKNVRFTAEDGRDRRFVICHNFEQAEKDRHDREAIVAALEDQLKSGAKSLVGNKGYRKYLQVEGKTSFGIDYAKVKEEERFDGKWVLRSNWNEANAEELSLRYKDLWRVEAIFRASKSVLETRPIYHQCDATIRGHVFCSFRVLFVPGVGADEGAGGPALGQGPGAGVGGCAARPGGVAGDAAGQRGGDLRTAEHAAGRGGKGGGGGGGGVGAGVEVR
ncbi:MAG: IS1634 family transposase [Planctomycetota bacterium]|nr:IS1634 family transposase [Planctomycetota bacterium]